MKIVAIMGSPHAMKGNTGTVLEALLSGAQNAGAETQVFCLGVLSVLPCNGCESCAKTGICPIDDDTETIKQAVLSADGMVLASPNYVNNVSAQTKAFLDRLSIAGHLQMLSDKYGAVIVTSGHTDTANIEHYLLGVLGGFGCWKVGSVGALYCQLINETEKAKVLESATSLGKRMVEAIRNAERFPEQEKERQELFATMKWLIQFQRDKWPFKYKYWKSRWGLKD